ncbi:Uncharacterised protein [Staphylococcus cohnii subsp. cohnii]|nr:Uncharacterised protein [Staphylococcus cohnii subsp. cohnii]
MFSEKAEKYKKYKTLANIFMTISIIALVFLLGFFLIFDWLFLDYFANFFKGLFILGLVFELIPDFLEKNKSTMIWGTIFILFMIFVFFIF